MRRAASTSGARRALAPTSRRALGRRRIGGALPDGRDGGDLPRPDRPGAGPITAGLAAAALTDGSFTALRSGRGRLVGSSAGALCRALCRVFAS
ncbi:MAG: hypothetical protein CMN31_01120 [Sandaracinus sp.]|nr:hypothetical protein [Sandaracinus sp.]